MKLFENFIFNFNVWIIKTLDQSNWHGWRLYKKSNRYHNECNESIQAWKTYFSPFKEWIWQVRWLWLELCCRKEFRKPYYSSDKEIRVLSSQRAKLFTMEILMNIKTIIIFNGNSLKLYFKNHIFQIFCLYPIPGEYPRGIVIFLLSA